MAQPVDSKLPDIGTTIFTVMSKLAADCGAINLSQGYPDFAVPERLLERVIHHLRAGQNQYAPMAGIPELRQQIAVKTEHLYGRSTNPDTEVTVTSGATEALFSAIEAFIHPGHEVIVFDPAYDSYDPAIRLAGGKAIHIPLQTPGFGIDWQRVDDAINPATRMIILNTPHNPTGAVLTSDDLSMLADLVQNTDIILLGDEVYEHIIFDQQPHQSLLLRDDLASRSLAISSFGKTIHATGWKVGYCVAPENLTTEFRKVHQFVQFCVVAPMQYALADFLANEPEYVIELPKFYQRKRDRFCELLAPSRFTFKASAGTYFQLVDYSSISDEPDVDFARRLTREIGVAAIPVSVFYERPPPQQWLRFCFAKGESTLVAATERLCKI
ncbi:MAG: pyridoxal phosphate-dependent aminotransferase [Gammaproteobacteria bacterium]|jgi:methionine aminotransferase|nr:methionine aminotransferase [Chromatiales bacterium]MDP6673623.1 pyridoxal phosphate-dependent aminotransferase [Gammaproteobacteria bacterium]